MKASGKKQTQKRVHFGLVTIVEVPATNDSQNSSLVNSQVISSDLRASVQRALPVLGALNPNSENAKSLSPKEERKTNFTLLGGDDDDGHGGYEEKAIPVVTSVSSCHQDVENTILSRTYRTQEPKLSLDPLLAAKANAKASTKDTTETQLSHSQAESPFWVESFSSSVERHTLDSEKDVRTQDEIRTETTQFTQQQKSTFSVPPQAASHDTMPWASPPRIAEPFSTTFSQLMAEVDNVLASQPSVHDEGEVHQKPFTCLASFADAQTELQHGLPSWENEANANEKRNMLDVQKQEQGRAEIITSTDLDERPLKRARTRNDAHDSQSTSGAAASPASLTCSAAPAHSDSLARCDAAPNASACVFCGNSPFGRQNSHRAPPLQTTDGYTHHLACALWCPEVYKDAASHELRHVPEAVRRACHIKCAQCRLPGATVGCAVPTCQLSYHLPCAVQVGAALDKKRGVLFCPVHRALRDKRCEAEKKQRQSTQRKDRELRKKRSRSQ